MKKVLLIGLALCFGLAVSAQQRVKHAAANAKVNVSAKKPVRKAVSETDNMLELKSNKTVKSVNSIYEETIGTSRYDLQTNGATQNRIYLHSDGSIGATYTFGLADAAFADRGTGYNYYDGSTWGPAPTVRIEDARTGWPSYVPAGPTGEMVASHLGTAAGLKMSKRTTKGVGNWNYSLLAGPSSVPELLWPRMVSGGNNNNSIHVLGLTAPVANSGSLYNGQDGSPLYYRSTDAGATWDITNFQLPQTDTNYYLDFSGDGYAMACKGNTVAIVFGDNWGDLFLEKSTDNGTTWTKTIIFPHPYQKFKETTTLVLDTPTVCDGSLTVAIDNSGKAHVAFGLMRVLNDDLTDGTTSYFPYTDGLGYWNEEMGTLTSLDIDSLDAQGRVVGWTQDLNGNDTIFEFVASPALYYMSVTSMPQLAIDEQNRMFLFFTSIMEHMDNGNQNYRHVWGRGSLDGGTTWGPFTDVTGGIIHNFNECVFPSLSPTTDGFCHLIYQQDEEPGLAVRGDADPYGDNNMVYLKVSKDNIVGVKEQSNIVFVNQNYPNPAHGNTTITMNLSKSCNLSFDVFNAVGQKVYGIPSTKVPAGYQSIDLNLNGYAPGLYFYTVKAGENTVTKKMIVE